VSARATLVRALATAALAAFSFGLALAVAEIALRVAGYRAIYETYSKPSLLWQHDALLGWAHEPGANDRYVGPRPWPVEFEASVSINALGLRGPEIPAQKGDELRVLFLGDSMVAGFEVENDQTFVARLGPELTRRLGRSVRTINAGVRGYGTDQYYLYFLERGRALAPDAVVVFHSGNDPADNATLHETRRPFGKGALAPAPDGSLRRVGFPIEHYPACEEVALSETYQVVRSNGPTFQLLCRAQMALFDHSALFSFLTLSLPWNPDTLRELYFLGNTHSDVAAEESKRRRLEHTRAITRALAREIRGSGAAAIWTGAPEDLAGQIGLETLREAGVIVQDLADVWYEDQLEVRFLHDSHFNPTGHARVAEILAAPLEAALRARARPDDETPR
jgi:lysophospholipase L1-like esterase